MKTFTNCAEKKAKQFLNLLQGYTKGIRMTAILVLLLMGVTNAWGAVTLKYQKDMPSGYYDASTSKTMTQSSANSYRYYCEIDLSANSNYGFFIIDGSDYYKGDYNGNVTATSNNSTEVKNYGSNNYGNSPHRVNYKSGTAGTYIFTYDASNHKICVSPKSSETIKIAYDVAQGHDNDWNLNNYVNLTQVSSTANYTIDLDLQAKKYYMFVQISNGIYWRAGSTLDVNGSVPLYYYGTDNFGGSGDKVNFTPTKAGKYRFTWNHQDKTIKLEPFYSVTYNGNSHTSGDVPTTSLHLKGSTVTVASNSGNLARTGYTFGGWNTNSAGTGTNYTAGSGSFTMGSSNTTLYAKWTPAQYTITYKDQGGSNFSGTHESGYPTTHTYGTATTLKTASKTGYTLEGWYKESACTNKVTSLGATAYTANITLYAKWTEKPKYTVTISSDGNGTVTPNTAQVGEIPVSITATQNDGCKFKNWTKTGNVTIADANNASTTITATGAGSVTANFEKQRRIYLKPAGDNKWAEGGAIFAIYVGTTWKDMAVDPSNTDIYYYDIPSGLNTVKFGRLNPANKATVWTETDNLTIELPCNLFDIDAEDKGQEYPSVKTGKWMEYDAWHLVGSFNDWTPCGQQFSQQNDGSYTFTRYLTTGTHSFKLVRNATWYGNDGTMTRENSSNWSMSTSEDDCEITADYTGDYTFTFNVSTKKLTVRYPILITLGYCDFGTYGIKYNGQSYFSKPNESVTINVPAGAQIEILEGQPLSNAYTGDVIKAKPTKEDIDQTLTINGDIMLDDNFVTKEPHVVYLGVPENHANWDVAEINNGTHTYYIWRKTSKENLSMTAADEGSYVFTKDGIKYYKFTIAAGCNNFCFQRKAKVTDGNYATTTFKETKSLLFQIPLTEVNCYTLTNDNSGTWGVLPAQPGDYRLLYVEQVVEKDANGNIVVTRMKAHPSNIIKKGTDRKIVSLHTYKDRKYAAKLGDGSTYESSNNPEIILQKYLGKDQFGNDQWEDVECQMVYGPLETLPIMANLPGRKNASPGSDIDDLRYHNGIENIKNDTHPDKGNGVWNFVVTQDNAGNASVQWNQTLRYTGEYYIRTDNAEGGWDQYTLPGNYMTYSQYAKDHSGFSHYFCKWVEKNITPNTKFVIANDHGVAISDTLAQDAYTDEDGDIAHDANIRWSWNMVNNEIARAYIQGTWKAGSQERNRNLVVNYKPSSEGAVEDLLDDSGDWIYQKDFPVKVGSHLNSLTATYPVTSNKTQTFASNLDMLTGDPDANKNDYKVRILYDFKINKTLIALVPNDKDAIISIDVLIERINQGEATQVQAPIAYTNNQRSGEGSTVYGVMSFDKSHLTDQRLSSQEKLTYWISFPFDVKLSEIFGFGEVGDYWMIKYYDGADRAAKGLYDDNTFWKFITNRNYTLKANQGYVLSLNKKVMDANSPIFTNTDRISLYFPSKEKLLNINTGYTQTTCTIPEYTCTITSPTDRRTKDSNWNFIGVPSFANKNRNTTNENLKYFYDYDYHTDTYSVALNSRENTFKSMFAYMVQFAGIIDWSTLASNGSQSLAAKKTDNVEKHVLRIELQQNNTKVDQTYIQLEDEEVTAMFDMNYDLTKLFNSKTNIYSLIPSDTDPIQVAANVMPIEETIIPLGIKLDAAGEYTFAMPEGTDGIVVELIDYETNTTTNMLLDNYTVNLGKGTFENRFALHVKPNKTTTSLEDVNTNSNGVKKYLIDGILYMQKDGVLYDAQGKLVR